MFLRQLHGHENIISVSEIIMADNTRDIYIVCDFMDTDLHMVIKAKVLDESHKKYILYQILKALKYIHSGSLIHRDLKPSNILLNSDCHVKLCDFGLARSVSSNEKTHADPSESVMTDYVATRWYRAPELLLGSSTYTKGIDLWAVGCILAEELRGTAVFPGKSTLDQLEKVLEVTGRPTAEDLDVIKSQYANQMLDSIKPKQRLNLSELFPKASIDALDCLRLCFQFNPDKRATADDLLAHPYVASYRDVSREIVAPGAFKIPLNDNIRLTSREYRTKLNQEIAKMNQADGGELRSTSFQRPVSRGPSNPPISHTTTVQFEDNAKSKSESKLPGTSPNTKGKIMTKDQSFRSLTPTTSHTVLNSANKSIPPVSPAASSSKSTLRTPSSNSRFKSPSTSSLVRSPSAKSLIQPQPKRQTTPVPVQRPSTPMHQVPRTVVTASKGVRVGTFTPQRSMNYALSILSGQSGGGGTKVGAEPTKTGTPPRKTTPPGKTPVVMDARPSSSTATRLTKSSSVKGALMGLFGRSATSSTSALIRSRPSTSQKR